MSVDITDREEIMNQICLSACFVYVGQEMTEIAVSYMQVCIFL